MKTMIPFLILLKALGLTQNKIDDVVNSNKLQVNSDSIENNFLNSQQSLEELNTIFLEQGINLV